MPDPRPSNADSLNSNFLQLGRRSGGRPQRIVYPRRLHVNTVIHTTSASIEPTTFRLLVRRATSRVTDNVNILWIRRCIAYTSWLHSSAPACDVSARCTALYWRDEIITFQSCLTISSTVQSNPIKNSFRLTDYRRLYTHELAYTSEIKRSLVYDFNCLRLYETFHHRCSATIKFQPRQGFFLLLLWWW